jgi:hypothetical protein
VIEVLGSVLSFPSRLFRANIHELAVKILLSIRNDLSITIIAYDVRCHAGVMSRSLLQNADLDGLFWRGRECGMGCRQGLSAWSEDGRG